MVESEGVLYFVYIFYSLTRPYLFAAIAHWIGVAFGFVHFGAIYGVTMTIASAVAFTQYLLSYAGLVLARGNWLAVDLTLLALSILSATQPIVIGIIARRRKRQGTKELDLENIADESSGDVVGPAQLPVHDQTSGGAADTFELKPIGAHEAAQGETKKAAEENGDIKDDATMEPAEAERKEEHREQAQGIEGG